MSGQVWAVSAEGGYLYSDELSDYLRVQAQPLTKFRTGAGPHTGVHLIMVRSDLGTIIHLHPPVGAGGRIFYGV